MFSRCLGSALASGRGRPFSVDSVACFCLSALGLESDRSFAETDGARFKNGCGLVRAHLEPETGHLLDGGGLFQDPESALDLEAVRSLPANAPFQVLNGREQDRAFSRS